MERIKCVVVGDGFANALQSWDKMCEFMDAPGISKFSLHFNFGMVGKSALLSVFKGEPFSEDYTCTVCDNYSKNITVNGQAYTLELWDTAGQEDYDRLRPLSYNNTSVFLLCFAFDRQQSLRSIEEKWVPEVRNFGPGKPIILVGCKLDARSDPKVIDCLNQRSERVVTESQGARMANSIGAVEYLECSSKTNDGIEEVFRNVVLASQSVPARSGLRCNLL